ncbi:MAG TPA: glycosyltransferase [Bryobacteraceae bacterium]|jgi:glycosyltransferase involved in cell wall biosynthesis|nr:glycosyltransferase [Bryobacteraceae bacterium]
MPPSKSGIADYSEALAAEMAKRVDLSVFDRQAASYDASSHDVALYHIGNNPWHGFAYEEALRHPGVVVMHEANLHHLIADLTIRRGDWDAYIAEAELNGGAPAREFALRARTLTVGPDYEGVAMTRRLLDASRGLVVHSDFVAREMRAQGFEGPIATIPHGAWIPQTDRNGMRQTLGIDDSTPLIGAFGYLKPYKRIAESLRALRRLVRIDPRVRMILAGETHPEFPVGQLIRTLGLDEHVRILGFTPIEKFVEYMGACDIVLNLRFPTVGETSGSLQRALGLGKAVIVSDIGSFAELPDDVCLKVPTGPGRTHEEEDFIFEYLSTLVARPDLAHAMGERARQWVERECNWGVVADRYVDFLGQFRDGGKPACANVHEERPKPAVPEKPGFVEFVESVEPEAIQSWIVPEAREYAGLHQSRFVHTLEMTPAGDESKAILEMGAYMQITPALRFRLGYGMVRGCYFGKLGQTDHKSIVSEHGETFECDVDLFDAERDVYPYADASFDTVLCCELIEHLFSDPMHMMSEINRILKPGGHVLITTPNLGSLRAIAGILQGYHPSLFPAYIRPRAAGEEAEARHNREYVPMEMQHLLTDSGFEVVRLETGEFLDEPHPEFGWIAHLLERYRLHETLRGDGIYALGRKMGPVKERWPGWLYV